MKQLMTTLAVLLATVAAMAQTLNVRMGSVTDQYSAATAGTMTFTDASRLTILGKTYTLSDITALYTDQSTVKDGTVNIVYDGTSAQVFVAGNVVPYITATVSGAHVTIDQSTLVGDDTCGEITYNLSGSSSDGSFNLTGDYKATVSLNGVSLTNPNGAPLNINNGKRIQVSAKKETSNTLSDAAGGSQKATLYCKGHLELQGNGTLTINGATGHAIKTGDYLTLKNLTLIINSAEKDGIHCNEYFLMKSGTVTIQGVGDDGIQAELDGTASTGQTASHEDEDSGNIYVQGGSLTMTITTDGAKGLKTIGDILISDGTVNITQTGGLVSENDDLSYPTSIKADGNVAVTGGSITIVNTAEGGKGISADGTIAIDESNATTVVDIKANGAGGTVENSGSGEAAKSYKVYVSLPGSTGGWGGSSAWKKVYLYKSNGTLVQQLTSTVTKSSGYSSVTFYYYDFGSADAGSYYFKSDNYTSRNTTYTIVSQEFDAPSDGTDVYYSITNSYTTSGTTRTYSLNNVTTSYSGTSDSSEENGTGYNAAGLKADGNVTIGGGTITIANSGAMSKSIKSKATVTVSGGNITLTPSGAMKVISSDASYSQGVKCQNFVMNDGTLTINASGIAGKGISANGTVTTNGGTITITATGAGQLSGNNRYTTKGIKADGNMSLNGGNISVTTTQAGAKGIKANGTYTQGTSGGSGPTVYVKTSGSRLSNGSSYGGMGGKTTGSGGAAKGIKAVGTLTIYGGETTIETGADGAEGLESKTSIDIRGGQHYLKCYDDCINSDGYVAFNGGVTVCYSTGNDAVDSNYGRSGAITIGNGVVLAYTSKGGAEMGLDCDNNSYIQITGTGIAIAAGGNQGGSSSATISGAKQGYYFHTSSISYASGRYYTLADSSGNNLVTYSFPASVSSNCSLFTATSMKSGSSYNVKYSTTAPTNATTSWHGLYLGSSHTGSTSVISSFTAK